MANFRQKVFFKTEDRETLKYINDLAGRVEVIRQSYTDTTGTNFQLARPIDGFSSNSSSAVNTQIVERQLIDANLVRQLGTQQFGADKVTYALAFLTVDGQSADDVLIMNTAFPSEFTTPNRYTTLATPQYQKPIEEGAVKNAETDVAIVSSNSQNQ